MSLDERIVSAVDEGTASTVAALAKSLATSEQVIKMRAGLLVKRGRLAWNGDELEAGAGEASATPAPRSVRKGKAPEPAEEQTVLLAVDEDGDLQISRRDGEGEIMSIPGPELGRLVAFVKRHFRDALRG